MEVEFGDISSGRLSDGFIDERKEIAARLIRVYYEYEIRKKSPEMLPSFRETRCSNGL